MNYFGLMFSFFIPGLILGFLFFAAMCVSTKKPQAKRRVTATRSFTALKPQNKLYVWDKEKDCTRTAHTGLSRAA